MIKFSEIISSPDVSDRKRMESEKWSQPLNDDVESANRFWDDLMATPLESQELTEEQMIDNIFGIEEDSFDFDIKTSLKNELAEKFHDSSWTECTEKEKKTAVEELRDVLAEDLNLAKYPKVDYYDGRDCDCGSYNYAEGKLEINRALLNNPNELIDTLAHEMRHAYQYERAEKLETFTDYLYRKNLENYISPIPLTDGTYLFYMDYYDQFVEAEARAYAKSFKEAGWKNE
ncbi:MAG: SprT-like domain-containing protein [Clostridiales bacterium]|nr:SprT-like domain-containing protein [Clostridiales bacterium]